MLSEVSTLLDRATPDDVDALNYDNLVRRGRRRRLMKRAVGATAAVVSAALLTVGVLTTQGPPSPEVLATPDSAAGSCTVVDVEVLSSRDHFQTGDPGAPAAEEIYTAGRPTASGPHFATAAPIVDGVAASQLDERSTTHNLEHGAVVIWFDPAQLDAEQIEEIAALVSDLHDRGFYQRNVAAGVLASPFTHPGIDSGAAVALRAWGTALDCTTWDPDAARQFVVENYGTGGFAPERQLAPHPDLD